MQVAKERKSLAYSKIANRWQSDGGVLLGVFEIKLNKCGTHPAFLATARTFQYKTHSEPFRFLPKQTGTGLSMRSLLPGAQEAILGQQYARDATLQSYLFTATNRNS